MHSHEEEGEHRGIYVVSLDQTVLLDRWARPRGFRLPDSIFFQELRGALKEELQRYFHQVEMLDEKELRLGLQDQLHGSSDPVISLDSVYTPPGAYLLESTRMVDIHLRDIGKGSRNGISLASQYEAMERCLHGKSVQLVDDVMFGGGTLKNVVDQLQQHSIRVSRIVVVIMTGDGSRNIQEQFPTIPVQAVRFYDPITDEVCERDFFVGMPMSGRLIGKNGLPLSPETGASYFLPFGNPVEWATIPYDSITRWSVFCLEQNIRLWDEIGKVSGRQVQVEDLERRPRLVSSQLGFVDQLRNFRDYYLEYI